MLTEKKTSRRPLWLECLIVVLVATAAMASMLPWLGVAKLFGVDMTKLSGIQFQLEFGPVFLFFLYGVSVVSIIALATIYLHRRNVSDLGFRAGFVIPITLGTLFGIGIKAAWLAVLLFSSSDFSFQSIVPDDVTWASYLAHYAYFLIGFIALNSFIEEFSMRAYPFVMLRERISPWVLAFVTAAVFTVGHFFVNQFSLPYALALVAFGLLYAYVYFLTDSIWAVVGIHNGVNWTSYTFFGTSWKIGHVFETTISGIPQWVNEYSSFATCMLAIAVVWVFSKTKLFGWAFPNRTSIENPTHHLRLES